MKLTSTPIPPAEARETMAADCVALLSQDVQCPLARAIADALALLDVAIEAHRP